MHEFIRKQMTLKEMWAKLSFVDINYEVQKADNMISYTISWERDHKKMLQAVVVREVKPDNECSYKPAQITQLQSQLFRIVEQYTL